MSNAANNGPLSMNTKVLNPKPKDTISINKQITNFINSKMQLSALQSPLKETLNEKGVMEKIKKTQYYRYIKVNNKPSLI